MLQLSLWLLTQPVIPFVNAEVPETAIEESVRPTEAGNASVVPSVALVSKKKVPGPKPTTTKSKGKGKAIATLSKKKFIPSLRQRGCIGVPTTPVTSASKIEEEGFDFGDHDYDPLLTDASTQL